MGSRDVRSPFRQHPVLHDRGGRLVSRREGVASRYAPRGRSVPLKRYGLKLAFLVLPVLHARIEVEACDWFQLGSLRRSVAVTLLLVGAGCAVSVLPPVFASRFCHNLFISKDPVASTRFSTMGLFSRPATYVDGARLCARPESVAETPEMSIFRTSRGSQRR